MDPVNLYNINQFFDRAISMKITRAFEPTPESTELIRTHLALVPKIVQSIPATQYVGGGTELDDLIQEGNIALMEAARKYDPAGGAKFATYATWYISLAVKRAIERQGKTVYIPTNLQEAYRKLKYREGVYLQHHGTSPSDADLGALLGKSTVEVRKLRGLFEAAPLESFQVDELPDE